MKVLITGPSGFIGRACLREILRYDYEIHAVSRSPIIGIDKVTWHTRDLRDPAQAVSIINELKPSLLLHGAWIATPGVYASSPENVAWVQSSSAMAVAFGEQGGKRFVGIGSSAEYDPSEAACVEDETPIHPATIYGKCKAATWFSIQAAAQHFGFSAAWARLFLPYGPGDPPQRLIPSVVRSLITGVPVQATDGLQKRDFIYSEDAAELLVRLLFSDKAGAFNIGTGTASTVRSVVEYLAGRCQRAQLVHFGALQRQQLDPLVLVADMTKVQRELGWTSSTNIQAGLDRVLEQSLGVNGRNPGA